MTLKTVNKNNPCPICGKPDQCSKSEDGGVCCYRVTDKQDGYIITKRSTSKDGRDYTVYQPADAWRKTPKQPDTNELWAAIYEYIFVRFSCENEEKQELSRRGGLHPGNYGTLPFSNSSARREVAQELLEKFGDEIFKCPGISKNCPSGKGTLPWIEGAEGLMIPVRDWQGRIQGILIRPRLQDGGAKYLWMTSSSKGGASATPRMHVPSITPHLLNQPGILDGLWITEGALKANVLSEIHHIPCVATPANNLEPATAFIESQPLQKFILAYDQDTNPTARKVTSKNLLKIYDRFPDHDFWLAVWDGTKAKGIDDLLQAGGDYQLLPKHEAIEYLSKFVSINPDVDENQQEDREFLRTEWSEALSLKARFGKDMAYVQEWNDFLVWNGTIWEQDSYGPAIMYKKHLDERLNDQLDKLAGMSREDAMKDSNIKWLMAGHKLQRLNNVVNHLKSEADMRKKVMEIPVVRNVITCPNGTIDLTTGELRKNKRSDWQQSFCPTKYNPEAKCARWLKLLDDVFLGSVDLIRYVQKLFGMAITGEPNDHLFPVFVGDGRNGKSTILGTIQQVLGSGLSGAVDSNHLCKGNDRHPTWLASFHGKRLMVAQETARGAELNVSLVKSLTGGDQITCRRMHENEWSFIPTHTLVLCTNERPNIPESNTAIWSRIALVPFKASFSKENGNLDTSLPVRILDEREGILNWLVQGALLYQQEGLNKPDEIIKQVQEYREDNDPEQSIILWLDQFNIQSDQWTRSGELYQHYYQWTMSASCKALGIKNFTIALTKNQAWERRTQKGYREFRKKFLIQKEI